MLLNYLEPWIKNRSEEVLSKYNECSEETYIKFSEKIDCIRERITDDKTKLILLELEEIFNKQQEMIVIEVYHQAFVEALQMATSIYK
ncbi:hypothetical protein M5W68_21995 [Paenibacillus larvae]|uniref:hypothetical protein n=1 Tax=Paenibacillus larvae TaxID=1464 RepID=UPI002281C7F7|nr:hypothetical protein [Paenibacillus larvae]MCY9510666.1 hypothetical protein [Paenibacillus larvae]MCY9527686.1 hypothetical protein [Paenibacillus larvae]